MIEVLRTGALATVQDRGRAGYAHLGVPRSGPADARSHRLANRLVGNGEDAATIEVTLGGAALRFAGSRGVAITGAPAPATVDGSPVPLDAWFHVDAGQVLELGTPAVGLRTYVAVSGGIATPMTLGSRATDTLSGLGPAPLRAGDLLPLGVDRGRPHSAPDVIAPRLPAGGEITITYRLGPRDDWFPDGAVRHLEATPWELTSESNRVGARLAGEPVPVGDGAEIPSEGMVLGAIEVPPSGLPIILLADHPATGGYPVIGVVDDEGVAALAQSRPGTRLRLARDRARR